MLLSVLALAAALNAVQPPADPPASTPEPAAAPADAVTASDVPARSAQSSIDAGLAAFKRRRYAQAETLFQEAVEADPSSAAAAYYLGYTYYKRAEPKRPFHPDKKKAADMFARAYELDPGFRPAWGPRS